MIPKVVENMKALINKTIFMNNYVKPIRLEYSDNDTYCGDTVVTIYDDYKISLVLTDDCGAVIDNKVFFPKRGDIMIFRPNEIHFGRFPKPNEYRFISFYIPVDFFDTVFPAGRYILSPFFDTSDDRINLLRLPEAYKNKMINMAEELLQILKDDGETWRFDLIAFAKLIEALDICSQCYPLQKDRPAPASIPFLVTKTMEEID